MQSCESKATPFYQGRLLLFLTPDMKGSLLFKKRGQGIVPVKLLAFSSRGFLRSDAGKPARFSFIRVRAVNKREL
jgi:hypothetical protein